MSKDVTLSLRIERKLSDRLERHARKVRRSKSSLAAIAIESYLEIQAQDLALIKHTRDAVRAGEPTVPNEDVLKWIRSWGTENELPMPSPRLAKKA
jgi:predicted transcriptional regulator